MFLLMLLFYSLSLYMNANITTKNRQNDLFFPKSENFYLIRLYFYRYILQDNDDIKTYMNKGMIGKDKINCYQDSNIVDAIGTPSLVGQTIQFDGDRLQYYNKLSEMLNEETIKLLQKELTYEVIKSYFSTKTTQEGKKLANEQINQVILNITKVFDTNVSDTKKEFKSIYLDYLEEIYKETQVNKDKISGSKLLTQFDEGEDKTSKKNLKSEINKHPSTCKIKDQDRTNIIVVAVCIAITIVLAILFFILGLHESEQAKSVQSTTNYDKNIYNLYKSLYNNQDSQANLIQSLTNKEGNSGLNLLTKDIINSNTLLINNKMGKAINF